MQGYTSGQGLTGIQSKWTLTETSAKLPQNREEPERQLGQGCRCCDVNLCPANVWNEPADHKQRWKSHWALICFDIRLHTWPRAHPDQWRCLKGGYTRCPPPLPANCFPFFVLFFLRCSHLPPYCELNRPAANIALGWPASRAGHLHVRASGLFCDVLLFAHFVASEWLHASADAVLLPKSFRATGHDRLSLDSLCRRERLTLMPPHTTMCNWGQGRVCWELVGILDCWS